MIIYSKLQALAIKSQTNDENVIREYLQHEFLQRLYAEKKSDELFFKGGTALRIIYHSPRYSEDLDFSVERMKIPAIENLMIETLDSLQELNLKTEIKTSKKTSGGYLGIFVFELYNKKIEIKVEVSQRNDHQNVGKPELIENPYIISYILMGLKQEILVSGKLSALLDRAKSRDWYDLYFMLRAQMLTTGHKQLLSQIKSKLEQVKRNFYPDLVIFLPKSHHPIIKDFKEVLLRELTRFGD